MTSEQEKKARDRLWLSAYDKWYDAYFNELVASKLIGKWQMLNDPAKVIIAFTASSSVVSGWALWNDPDFKPYWIVLAGIGAFLSIVTSSLTVPERINAWTSTEAEFAAVRGQTEILMTHMTIEPDFDVVLAHRTLETIITRYNDASVRIPNDILHTNGMERRCKKGLDDLLLQRNPWSKK